MKKNYRSKRGFVAYIVGSEIKILPSRKGLAKFSETMKLFQRQSLLTRKLQPKTPPVRLYVVVRPDNSRTNGDTTTGERPPRPQLSSLISPHPYSLISSHLFTSVVP